LTRGGWTRNGGALQCGCDMDEELRFVGGGWWGRSWQRTKELRMYEIGEFFAFLYFLLPVSGDFAVCMILLRSLHSLVD
jgi:hypothetical protein